ncbi:hypothetical protein ACFVJI_06140 [Streptomyces sp. NPDC127584]|uniref:hypothetical protein n=1 Tax=Streptomyces sp. NPDC127584 TaxID=3345403 RepID=UPI00364032E8
MRGSAAPTSPGAWDARSEALLGTPALTPRNTGGVLDAPAAGEPLEAQPSGIAPEVTEAATTDGATTEAADASPAAPPAPPAAPTPPAPPAARPRHGTADPVKVLMHRHRELCARAVDPLEIAAGLEVQGFTDRTAARFRHRDVFSLAEELYARVPRDGEAPAPPAPPRPDTDGRLLPALAPGAAAALTGVGLATTHGPVRLAVGVTGALLLTAALLLAVRRGPLRAPAGGGAPAAGLWTGWLAAYAVCGDGLLTQVLSGGPDGPWDLTPGPLLALALAVAPAAWSARLFADRARRRIGDSRGLADFAAGVRPLLLGTVALPLLALALLLAVTGFSPGALALGALLLLARLLTVHGFPEKASAALAAAGAAEALALTSVLAARVPVPGFDALAAPVRAAVDTWGPGVVPTLVCGAAALGLLAHATGSLSRASAHATP